MNDKKTTYNVYKSSMQAHKLIMPCGKVLHVTKGKFVTCNQDEIDYIEAEIKAGFKYLKKEGTTTSATTDPLAAMKEKLKEEAIREYLAKEQAELDAPKKEQKPEITESKISPANTSTLAALKQQSGK